MSRGVELDRSPRLVPAQRELAKDFLQLDGHGREFVASFGGFQRSVGRFLGQAGNLADIVADFSEVEDCSAVVAAIWLIMSRTRSFIRMISCNDSPVRSVALTPSFHLGRPGFHGQYHSCSFRLDGLNSPSNFFGRDRSRRSASLRTSSATTANPRPDRPRGRLRWRR
jgi:hypothetical protein